VVKKPTIFIIAEAGVNHNGSLSIAKALVDQAANAGSNAIKFQSFDAQLLVSKSAKSADYQKRATGIENQYQMLKSLELSVSDTQEIAEYCLQVGVEFISSPFDLDSALNLVKLGVKRLKIASGEITNLPFLSCLAQLGKPLILSTGMSTMDEVLKAVGVIKDGWDEVEDMDLHRDLSLLHCTSNYPAQFADVNLRAMGTIATKTGLTVGYSDHTIGSCVSVAAVALGARIIEKHITIDPSLRGPDHQASMGPDEFCSFVAQIRNVETALGSDEKQPAESEYEIRDVARRSICAARNLAAGTVIEPHDLISLRPGIGIAPENLPLLVGRVLCNHVSSGSIIRWSDVHIGEA